MSEFVCQERFGWNGFFSILLVTYLDILVYFSGFIINSITKNNLERCAHWSIWWKIFLIWDFLFFYVYQGLCQVSKNELWQSQIDIFFHEKTHNMRLAGGNRSMEGMHYRLVLYLCSGPECLLIGSLRCETSCYPLSPVWPISFLPSQDRLHLLKVWVKMRALALIFLLCYFSHNN